MRCTRTYMQRFPLFTKFRGPPKGGGGTPRTPLPPGFALPVNTLLKSPLPSQTTTLTTQPQIPLVGRGVWPGGEVGWRRLHARPREVQEMDVKRKQRDGRTLIKAGRVMKYGWRPVRWMTPRLQEVPPGPSPELFLVEKGGIPWRKIGPLWHGNTCSFSSFSI